MMETLIKQELRYDNIVSYNDSLCRINIIGTQGVGVIDHVGNNFVVSEDKLNPVPITRELLLSLGFLEYKPGFFGLWNESKKAICEISRTANNYWFVIINDFVANLSESKKKYLHEIQNLFLDILNRKMEVKI